MENRNTGMFPLHNEASDEGEEVKYYIILSLKLIRKILKENRGNNN